VKELCVRLAAKKLLLGAVIDLHGQLFESQIVELMNRKLSLSYTDYLMIMLIVLEKQYDTSFKSHHSIHNVHAIA
jgi:hypothetical protein